MTEVKIFAIYSQFLGEFTATLKDSYSQAYSPMCESSLRLKGSYLTLFKADDTIFYSLERNLFLLLTFFCSHSKVVWASYISVASHSFWLKFWRQTRDLCVSDCSVWRNFRPLLMNNSPRHCAETRHIYPALVRCWTNASGVDPTLNQRCATLPLGLARLRITYPFVLFSETKRSCTFQWLWKGRGLCAGRSHMGRGGGVGGN